MAAIESGIYRIVNVGRKTAITVPAENSSTIVNHKTPNQPGQQWVVRRSGGGYHVSDRVYGRYMVVDNATLRAQACLRGNPTLWEFTLVKDTTWKIKLGEYDLALDSNGGGDVINLWHHNSEHADVTWQFERLGDLPGDEHGSGRLGTTETDRITSQVIEQLAQKDKQLIELAGRLTDLAGQLADQNQRIVDQNQRIADQTQRITDQNQKIKDQEGEITALKKQTEEKDQQLVQANREVGFVLARAVQREESLYRDRILGAKSWGVAERTPGESDSLREDVDRLKSLMIQLMDKDNKMPNNMSRV